MKTRSKLLMLAAVTLACGAQAQTIERMKMTDGDLNCQQMYTEIKQMDVTIAQANSGAAADNGVGGQVAGAVAQQAVAQVAARSGFGGLFGGSGGSGGGLGGLLGSVVQQAAAPAPAAAGNPALAQQAAGRKEHLTGLFLGKGCKMSDVQ